MPLVTILFVAPFVAIVTLAWLPIGFAFWVPAIFLAIVQYTFLLFRYAGSGGTARDPAAVLERGFSYYIRGFSNIFGVLRNNAESARDHAGEGEQPWSKLYQPLIKRALSLLVWPILILVLYFLGIDLFSIIAGPDAESPIQNAIGVLDIEG